MVPEWGDLHLRLSAILLSSRAPTRDLLLRLSKALAILTASDLFKQQEGVPHLRAGRQRVTSFLFQAIGRTYIWTVFPGSDPGGQHLALLVLSAHGSRMGRPPFTAFCDTLVFPALSRDLLCISLKEHLLLRIQELFPLPL